MPRLCHVFTVPDSLLFIRGQTRFMQERGFDIHVITSPGSKLEKFGHDAGVRTYAVEMPRKITPLSDLRALWHLVRTIRKIKPDIVHSHTPKGGLLGMIAATILRVPVRVYHIRGLPYMTATGPKRLLMMATEWVSCRLAHHVISVGHMIREVAIEDRICPAEKVSTYHGGSGNGVDAKTRFNPSRFDVQSRRQLRHKLGIGTEDLVVGFVGRIFVEKGVEELAAAWASIRETYSSAHLVLVGEEQEADPISRETMSRLKEDPRVHFSGAVDDTAAMYSIFDVMALPTYREGVPNVLLEAASMQVPVVATEIPGCVEAVKDGITGKLVPVKEVDALADAIATYLDSGEMRELHGKAGRERMLADFQQERIWESIYNEYLRHLRVRGR